MARAHDKDTGSLKSNYEGTAQGQNITGSEIHFSS